LLKLVYAEWQTRDPNGIRTRFLPITRTYMFMCVVKPLK